MNQNIYQEKNVLKAVMMAALPAMLGQVTTLIYNLADTYFISLTKNPDQIAAVTLCTPVLLIIMSIALIFGSGGGSVIARMLGAKEDEKVKSISSYCLYSMFISGVIVAVLGLLGTKYIVTVVGADAQNARFTANYLNYIFIGVPFIMFANGMLHILRSVGMIKHGTIGLILGNITNIVLDFVFIVLLDMGTSGAALATSLGFVLTTVYYMFMLHLAWKQGSQLIPLSLKEFHVTKPIMAEVFKIGIPGALITILMSISNIVLNNYIGMYGSNAVAAYGIAYKLDLVPIMLSVGLSQGVAPLIGYYFGAHEITRMKSTIRISNLFGLILGAVFTLLFFVGGTALASLFLKEHELIHMSARFLCILGVSVPLVGIINMITSYFQALGKAIPSLFITLLRNVVLFIGSIILLNHFFGLHGVIAAQPVTETLLAIICMGMYLVSISSISKKGLQAK